MKSEKFNVSNIKHVLNHSNHKKKKKIMTFINCNININTRFCYLLLISKFIYILEKDLFLSFFYLYIY